MISKEFQKILDKISRIDIEAAAYVKYRYLDGSLVYFDIKDRENVLASLFSWSTTPQNFAYWNTINNRYNDLPKITKKGNVF